MNARILPWALALILAFGCATPQSDSARAQRREDAEAKAALQRAMAELSKLHLSALTDGKCQLTEKRHRDGSYTITFKMPDAPDMTIVAEVAPDGTVQLNGGWFSGSFQVQ